ncbi:MAG: hypothetical protein AB8H86_18515 [Polyangiales bacterium]
MGTRHAHFAQQMACVLAVAGLVACADNQLGTERRDAGDNIDGSVPDAPALSDASGIDAPMGLDSGEDAALLDAATDVGNDSGSAPIPARDCVFESEDDEQELDVGPGSSERLRFLIEGLPDPSAVESATLVFTSFDSDHPGEEGSIRVNGMGDLDLPAMVAWDNADGTGNIDVSGLTVAGENRIVFRPGPLPRSFFRIRDVSLRIRARVTECVEAPPPPDPTAVTRSMHFNEAAYAPRGNWVVPCPPGAPGHNSLRNYAFTASASEHNSTDCSGEYRSGGNRRGTATFRFNAVASARYRITIRSRHTENRNAAGALFIVDGVERRISQRSAESVYVNDVWGERRLEGDVDIVLDSSREGASDCVTSVTIEPISG